MKLSNLREDVANMQSLHDLNRFEGWMAKQSLMQEEIDILNADIARNRKFMNSKGY